MMPYKMGYAMNDAYLTMSDSIRLIRAKYWNLRDKYMASELEHLKYVKGTESKLIANRVFIDEMERHMDDQRRRHRLDRVVDWVGFMGLIGFSLVYVTIAHP